jgi:DNA-binding ferritin-like protein
MSIFRDTVMNDHIINAFIKVAGIKTAKPKCKGTKSSPVGSPRQRAFCGRMCGHRKKNTKNKGKKDPDSCINQALRRWKCRCSSDDQISLLSVSEILLDGFLGNKTAKEKMDDEACELLNEYVAWTRALYLRHQENHWAAKNYGDHLLFQRLYEEAQEIVDDAAERVVGLCGELFVNGEESEISLEYSPKENSLQSLIMSSIAIEQGFQDICKEVYETLKQKDMLTLGLDDLIMSQAGEGEKHIFLLQQSLKGYVE